MDINKAKRKQNAKMQPMPKCRGKKAQKNRIVYENETKNICFIDARKGFEEVKKRNRLRDEDEKRVLTTWENRKPVPNTQTS